MYFSQLYEKLIVSYSINIYSNTLQKLPTPRYIVFYNGIASQPDRTILHLSDAFDLNNGCLECTATMLNINYGRNKELLDKCRRLKDYSIFVDCVRSFSLQTKDLSLAINQAIDKCILEDVLKDILMQQRAEVHDVVLTTFNKELYESDLKKDAYMDGKAEGIAEGLNQQLINLIQKKLSKGKSIETIADELEETPDVIEKFISQMK